MQVAKSEKPRPFDVLSARAVAEVERLPASRADKDKILRAFVEHHEEAERKVDSFVDDALKKLGIITPAPLTSLKL